MDKECANSTYWRLCGLSEEGLRPPIVACALGRLYNKEAVLNFLLSRDEYPPEKAATVSHIRSLKDVVQLNLTPTPEP